MKACRCGDERGARALVRAWRLRGRAQVRARDPRMGACTVPAHTVAPCGCVQKVRQAGTARHVVGSPEVEVEMVDDGVCVRACVCVCVCVCGEGGG